MYGLYTETKHYQLKIAAVTQVNTEAHYPI